MKEALRSRKRLGNPEKEKETIVQEKGNDITPEVWDLNVEGLQHDGELPGLTAEKNDVVQVLKEECESDGNVSTGTNVELDENMKKKRGLSSRDGNEDFNGKMQIGGRVLRSMSRRGDDKKFDNEKVNADLVGKSGESGGIEKEKVKEEKVGADQFVCNGYEQERAKVKVKGKLKRKRGRPRKAKMEEQDRIVVELPRRRGRPPKVKIEEQDQLVGELPRKPGRPPKAGQKHNYLKVVHNGKGKECFGEGKKGLSTIDGVNLDTSDDKCSKSRSCGEELKKRRFSPVKKRDTGENLEINNNTQKKGKSIARQLVRDQIWELLKDAGWTVEYRPRNGKDYNDAVYVSLDGKTHWSITLAYNRLKMHCEAGNGEGKAYRPGFKFAPIPEEDFNILTKVMLKKRESKKKLKRKGKKGGHGVEGLNKKVKKEKQGNAAGMGQSMKGKKKRRRSLLEEDSLSATSSNGMPLPVKDHKRQKTQNKKRRGLLVRNAEMEMDSETDGYVPYNGKRTVLSWMIDLGTVLQNGKVQYMNHRRKCALLEGRITGDGIHCNCCNEIVTISKFEAHARSKLSDPLKNIYLEEGTSLFQCLLDSWNKQDESELKGFHIVDVTGEDPNDDTCGLCGDGGDLICCDGCPSTFHQSCLDIKKFPSGDWHCIYCCCKFCGSVDESTKQRDGCDDITSCPLFSCHLCEEKYHRSCIEANDAKSADWDDGFFCGNRCKELSERFEMLLGVKQGIGDGFSCTFIRRSDVGTDVSQIKLQMVECNSKLAVALSIMNECFMPYIDHRSGINLIHSIVYNCGSNLNRLNFSGFFTAILERDDEIISAASIRIHGNQLAEMPFIGTRSMYRRQGMARRLLSGIELALNFLNVELLVIPAISELRETWTSVFGFEPLEATIKQKIKKMNLMVFPHVDMLQKKILEHQYAAEKLIPKEVPNPQFPKHLITQEVANNCDEGGPSGLDLITCANILASNAFQINDNPSSIVCDSQIPFGSSINTPDITSETMHGDKGSRGVKFQELSGAAYDNFEVEDKTNVNTHDCVTVANYQDDQIITCQNSGSGCNNLARISTEATREGNHGASSGGVENFYGGEVADQIVTNYKLGAQDSLHHLAETSKLESQIVFCTKESKDSANIICPDIESTFPSTDDSGAVHHGSQKLLVAECAFNSHKRISGSCQLGNHDSVQSYSVGPEVQFVPINGCDSLCRQHSDCASGEVVCPTDILMHVRAPKTSANVPVNCKESSSAVSELNAEEAKDYDAKSPSLQTHSSSGDCESTQIASIDRNLASNNPGMNQSSKQHEPDLQVDQTARNNAPSSCSPNTASGMALHCASAGANSCGSTEVIVLSNQAS